MAEDVRRFLLNAVFTVKSGARKVHAASRVELVNTRRAVSHVRRAP